MPRAPKLPEPGEQTADDRRKISRRFIIHARRELKAGNRLQAGEKVWGAAVQYIKVIGEHRGWPHGSNDALRDIGRQILSENAGRDGIILLSDALNEAYHVGHRNFYENHQEEETVERAISAMEEALPVLAAIAEAPWPPVRIGSSTEIKRLNRITGRNDLYEGKYDAHGFALKPPTDQPVFNIRRRAGGNSRPAEAGERGKGSRQRRKPDKGSGKSRTVNVTLT